MTSKDEHLQRADPPPTSDVRSDWRRRALFASGIAVIFFAHFSRMTVRIGEYDTAIQRHIAGAERLYSGEITIFYPMYFHIVNFLYWLGIPREIGAPVVLGVCVAIVADQMLRYFNFRIDARLAFGALAGLTVLSLVVNNLYLPNITRGVYLGQWGPNVYHNSTSTVVRVFTIPCFLCIARFARQTNSHELPRIGFAAALLLAFSMYAKPTLFLAVAPAGGLFVLLCAPRNLKRAMAYCAVLVPGAAVIAYQYWLGYHSDTSAISAYRHAIRPFAVWSHWSNNVPLSIAFVWLFPLAVTFATLRTRKISDDLVFAWLVLVVGFVQAALFAEVHGSRGVSYTANWFGGYLIGTQILYVVACAEFYKWITGQGRAAWRNPVAWCVGLLFTAGLVCGAIYLTRLGLVESWFA